MFLESRVLFLHEITLTNNTSDVIAILCKCNLLLIIHLKS